MVLKLFLSVIRVCCRLAVFTERLTSSQALSVVQCLGEAAAVRRFTREVLFSFKYNARF